MLQRGLFLTFALLALTAPCAASGAALAAKEDTLVPKKEVVPTPDTTNRNHLGRLSIVSTPPKAEVSVDSLPKGYSPVIVDSLTPGPHVIIVKEKGYFGKKVFVDALADTIVTVAVRLVAPARVVVLSDPAGATASVDGKGIGATPCDNPALMPGSHALKLDKAGFVSLEKQVVLTEGKADTISVVLRPVPQTGGTPKQPAFAPTKTGLDRVASLVALGAFVLLSAIMVGLVTDKHL
jgi:hypothetical protein